MGCVFSAHIWSMIIYDYYNIIYSWVLLILAHTRSNNLVSCKHSEWLCAWWTKVVGILYCYELFTILLRRENLRKHFVKNAFKRFRVDSLLPVVSAEGERGIALFLLLSRTIRRNYLFIHSKRTPPPPRGESLPLPVRCLRVYDGFDGSTRARGIIRRDG